MKSTAAALAFLLLLCLQAAHAQVPLGSPGYVYASGGVSSCQYQNGSATADCVVNNGYGAGGGGLGIAAYKGQNGLPDYTDPYVSAAASTYQAVGGYACCGSGYGAAELVYSFAVWAPGDGVQPISLYMTTSGSTSANGSETASAAQLAIGSGGYGNVNWVFDACLAAGTATGCGGGFIGTPVTNASGTSINVTAPLSIYTNTIYGVYMEADVSAGPYGAIAGVPPNSGTATIDPYFFLPASTLALYPNAELAFSDGVEQSMPPVPLPASFSLMLSGLCCFGFLMIVQRRRAA